MKLLLLCFVKCLPLTLLLGSLFVHPYLADNSKQVEPESIPQDSYEIDLKTPATDENQKIWIELCARPAELMNCCPAPGSLSLAIDENRNAPEPDSQPIEKPDRKPGTQSQDSKARRSMYS